MPSLMQKGFLLKPTARSCRGADSTRPGWQLQERRLGRGWYCCRWGVARGSTDTSSI